MKDFGKPKYRSLLQLEHLHSYIMIHHVVYIQNILENSLWTNLTVVHSLDIEKGLFRPRDDGNEILGLNVP